MMKNEMVLKTISSEHIMVRCKIKIISTKKRAKQYGKKVTCIFIEGSITLNQQSASKTDMHPLTDVKILILKKIMEIITLETEGKMKKNLLCKLFKVMR